jgi:hypothetical protein
MKFLQKRQNERSFTKSDYVVLSYEQLLQVNGAGGSSSGGGGPSGPSGTSGINSNSSSTNKVYQKSSSEYNTNNNHNSAQIETLMESQQNVISNPLYQQGSTGPCNYGGATSETTWCNQATFEVAEKTNSGLASAMYGTHKYDTNANVAAQNLQYYANNPNSSIQEINGSQAQNLANSGYTVIAAYENTRGGSGHLSTVAPGYDYNASSGPVLANVGLQSQTGINTTATVYGSHYSNGEVHYYFNANQKIE